MTKTINKQNMLIRWINVCNRMVLKIVRIIRNRLNKQQNRFLDNS